MHKHVEMVDHNSQGMSAELHKMHGSVSDAEKYGMRLQAQLQIVQQQLVRPIVTCRKRYLVLLFA